LIVAFTNRAVTGDRPTTHGHWIAAASFICCKEAPIRNWGLNHPKFLTD